MEVIEFGISGSGIGYEIAKRLYLMGFFDEAKLINTDKLTEQIEYLAKVTPYSQEHYKDAILQIYSINIPKIDFKKLSEQIGTIIKKQKLINNVKQSHKPPYKYHK